MKEILHFKLLSSLPRVRLVFWTLPHLNIFCTSSVYKLWTKEQLLLRW